MRWYSVALILLSIGVLITGIGVWNMASAQAPDEELIARGEYLTVIAGCVDCHTPRLPEYQDLSELTIEQAQAYVFRSRQTKDESRLLAGGEVFDLGPLGTVTSRNLTPDVETGLGTWTDEEIKRAFQQNLDIHGHNLFPLMPAHIYNNMADEDADAIVAYLRSLPPIENQIASFSEHRTFPTQRLPAPGFGPTAPDPSDIDAYSEYLMTAVLICSDCHSPLDPETGQVNSGLAYAGGQPFEGPWGIVYGGNITPHDEAGIGAWSDGELRRAIMSGIRPDGRQLVLMPWEYFVELEEQDIAAVTHYIRNWLVPVDREVPDAALEPSFEQFIGGAPTEADTEADEDTDNSTLIYLAISVAVILFLGTLLWLRPGRSTVN